MKVVLTTNFFNNKYAFTLYADFIFYLNNPLNGVEIKQAEQRNKYGINSQ